MIPIILHVDMDSFFASIEVRKNPALRGLPVVVGADPKGGTGRGVVSTASYEARAFGIRSGMAISRAYALCPQAIFLPVDFSLYREVSRRIMEILISFADRLEPVSIDEAFLIVTRIPTYDDAITLARKIQKEILEKEQLSCSIGIGPSRTVAKIASDIQKPGGLTVVPPDQVEAFLLPLPVHMLPGIGKKTDRELAILGVRTIGELARIDIQILRERFGRWGLYMDQLAHGGDLGSHSVEETPRSLSREITFDEDTRDSDLLERTMDDLAKDLHESVNQEGVRFRTVTIKVRDEDFTTVTRSRTLPHPSADLDLLCREAGCLLREFLDGRKIRLLGVRVSHLTDSAVQESIGRYIGSPER